MLFCIMLAWCISFFPVPSVIFPLYFYFFFLAFPWNHLCDVAFNSWPPLLPFVVIAVISYFPPEQLLSRGGRYCCAFPTFHPC